MSNSRDNESTNRGYESEVEPVRVCKSHEVVLEEVDGLIQAMRKVLLEAMSACRS